MQPGRWQNLGGRLGGSAQHPSCAVHGPGPRPWGPLEVTSVLSLPVSLDLSQGSLLRYFWSLSCILAVSFICPWNLAICVSPRATFRAPTLCVLPKTSPQVYLQDHLLHVPAPKASLLHIFPRTSPLQTPPAKTFSPCLPEHLSSPVCPKSISPTSPAPSSWRSRVNTCELELHGLLRLPAEPASSAHATLQPHQLFPVQTEVIKSHQNTSQRWRLLARKRKVVQRGWP